MSFQKSGNNFRGRSNYTKIQSQDVKEINDTINHIKSVHPNDFNVKKVILLNDEHKDSNFNKKTGILFVNRKDTRRYQMIKDLVLKDSKK